MKDIGVEIGTSYRSGHVKKRFIERREIKDVIINEGITMCRVIFYLAFITETDKRMTIAFESSRPPLSTLKKILVSAVRLLNTKPELTAPTPR
jgi:hypothetical protein